MPQEQESSSPKFVQESTGSNGHGSGSSQFHVAIVDVKFNKDGGVSDGSNKDSTKHEYLCGYCDKIYDKRDQLMAHVCFQNPSVNILYECRECKTLYQSLDILAEHMKEHEQHVVVTNKDKQPLLTRLGYRCSLCDKCLSSKGSLVKHQQLHKGVKPYCCNYCRKSFSLKGNRDKHELIHAGERPHKCGVCEKSFTLKGNLQQHILTHTSLKMFKCPTCGNEFTLKGNLSKHMKRHENGMTRCTPGRRPKSLHDMGKVDLDELAEQEEMDDTVEEARKPVTVKDEVTKVYDNGKVAAANDIKRSVTEIKILPKTEPVQLSEQKMVSEEEKHDNDTKKDDVKNDSNVERMLEDANKKQTVCVEVELLHS